MCVCVCVCLCVCLCVCVCVCVCFSLCSMAYQSDRFKVVRICVSICGQWSNIFKQLRTYIRVCIQVSIVEGIPK